MRSVAGVAVIGFVSVVAAGALLSAQGPSAQGGGPPAWAYGIAPGTPMPGANPAGGRGAGAGRGGAPAAPPDVTPQHVPGSTLTFTLAQIRDGFGPADWFPGDHPAMPDVVAHGRMPDVRACALCHYPNGKGRPENAAVVGFSAGYITQQLVDFKNDLRKSADPRKNNTNIMATIAKGMTDAEIKAASDYFASIKMTTWVKVVESATAPKTRLAGGLYSAVEGNETEPIGNRIVEVPENSERTETLRDPRSSFIAYVPVGSVKKGENMVTTGGAGKTTQCGVCHGADLKGLGPVPGIAGRSPSYLFRMMYDMQAGTRKGAWSDLMKPVVAKLTEDDMLVISAYAASLAP